MKTFEKTYIEKKVGCSEGNRTRKAVKGAYKWINDFLVFHGVGASVEDSPMTNCQLIVISSDHFMFSFPRKKCA